MQHLIYSVTYSVVSITSLLLTTTLNCSVRTMLVYDNKNIQSIS